MTAVLSREDIHHLLGKEPPLVEDWIDLEQQVQPNGFHHRQQPEAGVGFVSPDL